MFEILAESFKISSYIFAILTDVFKISTQILEISTHFCPYIWISKIYDVTEAKSQYCNAQKIQRLYFFSLKSRCYDFTKNWKSVRRVKIKLLWFQQKADIFDIRLESKYYDARKYWETQYVTLKTWPRQNHITMMH